MCPHCDPAGRFRTNPPEYSRTLILPRPLSHLAVGKIVLAAQRYTKITREREISSGAQQNAVAKATEAVYESPGKSHDVELGTAQASEWWTPGRSGYEEWGRLCFTTASPALRNAKYFGSDGVVGIECSVKLEHTVSVH